MSNAVINVSQPELLYIDYLPSNTGGPLNIVLKHPIPGAITLGYTEDHIVHDIPVYDNSADRMQLSPMSLTPVIPTAPVSNFEYVQAPQLMSPRSSQLSLRNSPVIANTPSGPVLVDGISTNAFGGNTTIIPGASIIPPSPAQHIYAPQEYAVRELPPIFPLPPVAEVTPLPRRQIPVPATALTPVPINPTIPVSQSLPSTRIIETPYRYTPRVPITPVSVPAVLESNECGNGTNTIYIRLNDKNMLGKVVEALRLTNGYRCYQMKDGLNDSLVIAHYNDPTSSKNGHDVVKKLRIPGVEVFQ